MAKRHPKIGARLKGTSGDKLPIALSDGTTHTLTLSLRDRPDVSSGLSEARRITLVGVQGQEASIRAGFREGLHDFAERKLRMERRGDPSARDISVLRAAADASVRKSVRTILGVIEDGVRASVRREVKAHDAWMRGKGADKVSDPVMETILKEAVHTAINVPFPGTKESTRDRLAREAYRARKSYDGVIVATGDDVRPALQIAREKLYASPSSGFSGGNISKSVQRINRTEQSRALSGAAASLAAHFGVKMGYWRLNPSHPNYGGGEVCEKIAAGVGPGVLEELDALGLLQTEMSIAGLYLYSAFPELPHPNCMCYQEFFVVGQRFGTG